MTKPVITCFSEDNNSLKFLKSELNKYYGSVTTQTVYQKKLSFFDSLKNNNVICNKTQIFIVDVNGPADNYMPFINEINQFCPTSIKLIVADNNNFSKIKNLASNNGSMLYLKKPWYSDDFNSTLNLASDIYSNSYKEISATGKKLNFNEQVEDTVNKRFQKLIDSNIAKESFLSIISHDLKSPFVALQGISEILLNDWKTLSDETKLELVADLHKTSTDTFKLLESLLEWANLQKEKLEFTMDEVKVHNLVNSTLKVSKNFALVKRITIQNKVDSNIKIRADKNIIATVFRNLISNAVQYTKPGGAIDISAKMNTEDCIFCVADNGSGIDKPHILELFNKGSKNKLNGNASSFKGLGLIICKDFVEKSGGQIWLETQKGLGSKFFFTVPC